MAVTLPGRDRERLIRTLAASAIRRPLSPADLRFLRATENGLPAHLPCLPIRRPSSPTDLRFLRATENGLPAHLPCLPIRRPSSPLTCASSARPKTTCPHSCRVRHSQALSLADLRFPARPKTAHPRPCRVRHSQALFPADQRFPRATANVPARGISQAPGDGLRPSGTALAVPPRHVGQKMFKFYNSLKIALSPVDSGMRACYNVPSGYPVVCATPVLLPTDSKKDSGSVSVDAMPPISDRPGKAANGRRSPPCLSGG